MAIALQKVKAYLGADSHFRHLVLTSCSAILMCPAMATSGSILPRTAQHRWMAIKRIK
ncbi:predicted protein [Plenodomus lingam JN3]|uniref:Predicted protein n=1 Tax=Leptosphaeria maculans (strain JN3 / isolate v23.1.3 / race Av1-4-5-6-7-8) TaxID=985895 RepID=E5AFK4_LEPMJ|nr:predicted protein [Plenodomus lingam JN3]CBY01993.1 predicted protein [Plenodomus lingam JN3]